MNNIPVLPNANSQNDALYINSISQLTFYAEIFVYLNV